MPEPTRVTVPDASGSCAARYCYLLASNFLGDDPHARAVERELQIAFGPCRFRSWPEQRGSPPGLVYAGEWRLDEEILVVEGPWHTYCCAGIGRKL